MTVRGSQLPVLVNGLLYSLYRQGMHTGKFQTPGRLKMHGRTQQMHIGSVLAEDGKRIDLTVKDSPIPDADSPGRNLPVCRDIIVDHIYHIEGQNISVEGDTLTDAGEEAGLCSPANGILQCLQTLSNREIVILHDPADLLRDGDRLKAAAGQSGNRPDGSATVRSEYLYPLILMAVNKRKETMKRDPCVCGNDSSVLIGKKTDIGHMNFPIPFR